MKGKIRWFDTEGGDTLGHGGVDGANGKQYEFDFTDWRGGMWVALPEVGMEVVFGTDENRARDIYPDDRVYAIVRQFPGPVTLLASLRARARWIGLLLASGSLAALSLFGVVKMGDPVGWFGVIFFGPGAIVAGINLLPGTHALRLDKDGFEIAIPLRRQRIAWDASLLLTDPSLRKDRNLFLTSASLHIRGLSSVELLRVMTAWCKLALSDEHPPTEEYEPTRAPSASKGVSDGARFQE